MSAQRSVGCPHGLRRGVGGVEGKISMVGYHAVYGICVDYCRL